MEVIRSLVQNLVVIIILAMFLEMLLPAGEMRKYVKMVMGLLIIIAVVQAVGDLTRWDYHTDLPSLTQKADEKTVSGIMEAGKKISSEQRQQAVEQYREGLAGQILALTRTAKETTVLDVEVNVQSEEGEPDFGRINEVVLYVAREPGGAGQQEKGGSMVEVEPVTVQVIGKHGPEESKIHDNSPPKEITDPLVGSVANFYNLKPEQVKVVYK